MNNIDIISTINKSIAHVFTMLFLSLREAAHSGSGVITMGREVAVSGSPIYPGQF